MEHSMKDQVLKAMKDAGKPVRPGDVANILGADSKEVSMAIKDLRQDGAVVSPKRCFYEPA
jgi:predicted transcriptional regulator